MSKCTLCNSDAYVGLHKTECSNPRCKFRKAPSDEKLTCGDVGRLTYQTKAEEFGVVLELDFQTGATNTGRRWLGTVCLTKDDLTSFDTFFRTIDPVICGRRVSTQEVLDLYQSVSKFANLMPAKAHRVIRYTFTTMY